MNTLPLHAQNGNIPHYVYRWIDPRDNSIFYIGITSDLYGRYRQHMRCDGINPQKDSRIQEVLVSGHLPIMQTIEQVASFEKALERELYWIHHYLQQGVKLTNIVGNRTPEQKSQSAKPEHKPLPVPSNFVRYSTDRFLKKLFFRTAIGSFVCFTEATNEEFVSFISRYANLEEHVFSKIWEANGVRCQMLNDIRIAGIEMEIYDAQGKRVPNASHPGKDFFRWMETHGYRQLWFALIKPELMPEAS